MGMINQGNFWIFLLIMVWVLPWKGYALWTSAKLGHKIWFIVLLIVNTLALLDIFYIFFVAKKKPKDPINDLKEHL